MANNTTFSEEYVKERMSLFLDILTEYVHDFVLPSKEYFPELEYNPLEDSQSQTTEECLRKKQLKCVLFSNFSPYSTLDIQDAIHRCLQNVIYDTSEGSWGGDWDYLVFQDMCVYKRIKNASHVDPNGYHIGTLAATVIEDSPYKHSRNVINKTFPKKWNPDKDSIDNMASRYRAALEHEADSISAKQEDVWEEIEKRFAKK